MSAASAEAGFDELRGALEQLRYAISIADLHPTLFALESALGAERANEVRRELVGASLAAQIEAVAAFVSQVFDSAALGECLDRLLSSVPDPVDGVSKLAHLRRLRGITRAPGAFGALGDRAEGFVERGSLAEHGSANAGDARGLRIIGLDTDSDTIGDEEPLRATLSLDLDPVTLLAIQCIIDARAKRREIRIVTEPDLVAAVDELLYGRHGSPSVGAAGPESPSASEPIVGAADGVTSFGTPSASLDEKRAL